MKKTERRQGQSRLLSLVEIKRVLQGQVGTKHQKRNTCLLTMGFYGGTRVMELSGLKLCDVLNKDWTVKETVILRKEYTKTKETRQLFLTNKTVRKSIEDYVTERRELDGLTVRSFNKPLFKSQKGTGFTNVTLQRCIKDLFRKVGLDDNVSTHSMRRTFITNLFEDGINVKIISKLVGHKNIQTTMNTYYTVRNDVLKDITENVVLR
jgi:integrase/recombinase XerD